jgi:predicted hydrolase (HD superfamily)
MRYKAIELLNKYLLTEKMKKHSLVVEAMMIAFAKFFNPDQLEIWSVAGILHDLDYDITSYKICPQLHGLKTIEILKDENFGNEEIYSIIAAHNEKTGIKAESIGQKIIISSNITANIIYEKLYSNSKKNYIKFDYDTILKDNNIYDRQTINLIESTGIKINHFIDISLKVTKNIIDNN